MSASRPGPDHADYGKKIPLAQVTVTNGVIASVSDEGRQFAGSQIDPAADLRVHSLTVDAGLTVEQGRDLCFKAGISAPSGSGATLFSKRPTASRRPGSTRSPGLRTSCI